MGEITNLAMCRVCLTEDIGMRSIANTHLQEVYEGLTSIALEMGRKPLQVCYICCAVLQNCYWLRQRCLRAEEFLRQVLSSDESQPSILKDNKIFTQQFKVVHSVVNLSIDGEAQSDTRDEAIADIDYETQAPEALEHVVVDEEPVKVADDIHIKTEDVTLEETHDVGDSPGPSSWSTDHVYTKVAKVKRPILNKTKKSILAGLLLAPQKKIKKTSVASTFTSKKNQANTQVETKNEDEDIVEDLPTFKNKTSLKKYSLEKSYSCEMCSESFSTFTQLKEHIYVHSKHRCNICKKGFLAASHLKVHMRVHTGKNTFHCKFCSKFFTNQSDLVDHVRSHSDEKPITCDVCKKGYRRIDALKNHMREHTGDKPYVCDVCKKCFSDKFHLTEHTRLHTGEKPFCCDVCKKCFSRKCYLIAHNRSHSSEKYMCDICMKCFSGKQYLAVHSRLHTGERFLCDVCKKDFINKCSLVRHMRVHNSEKPYMCDVCGQSFKERSHLKRHTLVHTGEKPYKCNECGKRFTQKINLEGHVRTHTGEKPYRCEFCKEDFSYHRSFKSHVRKHIEGSYSASNYKEKKKENKFIW